MDFQILMTKFRTLEATILGLVNTNKTYDELLAEVETLEIQIRKEAMRDGGLPYFLIQKTYDDLDNVKNFLKERIGVPATPKVETEEATETIEPEQETETIAPEQETVTQEPVAEQEEPVTPKAEVPKKKGNKAKEE